MSQSRPQEIPKGRLERVGELLNAIQIIRDSLTAMAQLKEHYIIPLSGQLRALLTDRTRGAKPLLLDLAAELDRELWIYGTKGVDHVLADSPIADDILFRFGGVTFSLNKELSDQGRILLNDALNENVINFQGAKHSLRDVVGFFANRAGGAHYSTKVPEELAKLVGTTFWGQSPLRNAMWQLGLITVALGSDLLRCFGEFECHLTARLVAHSLQGLTTLVEVRYPDRPMEYSITVDRAGRLRVRLFDIHGVGATFTMIGLIPTDRPFHFAFRLRWNDALDTEVELTLDGQPAGSGRVPRPLFLVADPVDYDVWFNRTAADPHAGGAYCLGDFAVVGQQDVASRGETVSFFTSAAADEETKCLVYMPGQYGHIAPGSSDLTVSDGVARRHFRDWYK